MGSMRYKMVAGVPARRNYQSKTNKILIIKLAAIGDVLRTTPILRALKRKYPDSLITWVTEAKAARLLENNNYIDRLLVYDLANIELLKPERFDILICLDKEIQATALACQVKADKKFGFGLDEKTGDTVPMNKESIYAWRLGLSNQLKFRKNRKTYPRIISEMARLDYKNDEYILNVPDLDKKYARNILYKTGLNRESLIIGLNTGAGNNFANKAWTEQGFIDLIRLIRQYSRINIFLLGGPQESRRNARIISQVGKLAYDVGCYHDISQFASIIDLCSLVVSADTAAMHIAIALKKRVVALFGATCEQEIELYGRGVKIASSIDCRPCYRSRCDKEKNCMSLIKPFTVFEAIEKLLTKRRPLSGFWA